MGAKVGRGGRIGVGVGGAGTWGARAVDWRCYSTSGAHVAWLRRCDAKAASHVLTPGVPSHVLTPGVPSYVSSCCAKTSHTDTMSSHAMHPCQFAIAIAALLNSLSLLASASMQPRVNLSTPGVRRDTRDHSCGGHSSIGKPWQPATCHAGTSIQNGPCSHGGTVRGRGVAMGPARVQIRPGVSIRQPTRHQTTRRRISHGRCDPNKPYFSCRQPGGDQSTWRVNIGIYSCAERSYGW